MSNLNKNISVWRGDNIPPTEYHLWVKDNGDLFIKVSEEWKVLAAVLTLIDLSSVKDAISTLNSILIEEENPVTDSIFKSYKLTVDGEAKGITIDIPKDSFLKDVKLGHNDASVNSRTGVIDVGSGNGDPQYLIYSMLRTDGSYTMIKVDLSSFISEKEYSDGLTLNGSTLKVLIDSDSDSYLSVSDKGIKISGITTELDEIKSQITSLRKTIILACSNITLESSPKFIEKGISTPITLTWNFLFNNLVIAPSNMYLLSDGITLVSNNTTYNDNINTTKAYQVFATYEGVSISSNLFTVKAYNPMYFGEGDAIFDIDTLFTSINKLLIRDTPTGNGSVVFTNNKYLWLCIPKEMSINKVTSDGFNIPLELPITNGDYKCYRSTDIINTGIVNFEVYGN